MLAQQLSVKFFAKDPSAVRAEAVVPVFHRWIQQGAIPDQLLIDVADYRHVPSGPKVALIAHQAHYVLDEERGPLGLLYNRKRDTPGPLGDKLVETFREALHAARLLETDPAAGIQFDPTSARLTFLSRRYVPQGEATFREVEPVVAAFATRLWPGAEVSLTHLADPRAPLAIDLSIAGGPPISELAANLA